MVEDMQPDQAGIEIAVRIDGLMLGFRFRT